MFSKLDVNCLAQHSQEESSQVFLQALDFESIFIAALSTGCVVAAPVDSIYTAGVREEYCTVAAVLVPGQLAARYYI